MLHVESLNCTQQAIKDLNPPLFTIKLRIPISSSTSDKYLENGKLPTSYHKSVNGLFYPGVLQRRTYWQRPMATILEGRKNETPLT